MQLKKLCQNLKEFTKTKLKARLQPFLTFENALKIMFEAALYVNIMNKTEK